MKARHRCCSIAFKRQGAQAVIADETLARHRFEASMERRGNPDDTAKAESVSKTLQGKAVYLMASATFEDAAEDAAADLPRFVAQVDNTPRLHSAPGYLSPSPFEDQHAPLTVKSAA